MIKLRLSISSNRFNFSEVCCKSLEMPSVEVPVEVPVGSLTNQVQQSEFSISSKNDQIQNFKIESIKTHFLAFNYLFGLIGWIYTIRVLITLPVGSSSISPACYNTPVQSYMYQKNFSFDLHAFISENETNFFQENELVWRKSGWIFGDFRSVFSVNKNVSISEVGSMNAETIFKIMN